MSDIRPTDLSAEVWHDLVELGKLLTSSSDVEHILDLIMDKVQARIEADNWSLLLVDGESRELVFKVAKGIDRAAAHDIRLMPGEGIAGSVASSGEALYVRDVESDGRFCSKVDERTGFRTRSIVCIPLKSRSRVLGVIEVVNLADFDGFVRDKVPMLQVMADYAAIALENARIIGELELEAVTDSLTGLFNDHYLTENLSEEIGRAAEQGRTYSVAFLDLDNFKTVVDTYGHQAGSKALALFGGFLKEVLPADYILVRFGGDEFLIAMPDTGGDDALSAMRSLAVELSGRTFCPAPGACARLTASAGVATLPDHAGDLRELLRKADLAMYAVKNSSKNSVALWSDDLSLQPLD